MMRRFAISLLVLAVAGALTAPAARGEESKDQAALAKALAEAKVSLEKALVASRHEGKPISAKFEIGDDGKLQLSVYTAKGDAFSEVIVDHKTGTIAKAEPITQGDDLTHAKEQSQAMAKAKRSLGTAASEAAKQNKGYRVVSIFPTMKDGHPVADVTLVKGNEWKTVSEKLD